MDFLSHILRKNTDAAKPAFLYVNVSDKKAAGNQHHTLYCHIRSFVTRDVLFRILVSGKRTNFGLSTIVENHHHCQTKGPQRRCCRCRRCHRCRRRRLSVIGNIVCIRRQRRRLVLLALGLANAFH